MKNLFLVFLLVFTICSFSQSRTEKWNSLYGRYEYFNSYGTMIGYKKYNSLYERWEYYDLKTNNNSNEGYKVVQPPQSVDIELARSVLNSKQAKYDSNMAEIQQLISELCQYGITKSENASDKITKEAWIHATYDFRILYVEKFENSTGDLSSKNRTQQIKTWLRNNFDNLVIKYVINQEKFIFKY